MLKQPFQGKYWLKHEQMNKQMTFSINGGKKIKCMSECPEKCPKKILNVRTIGGCSDKMSEVNFSQAETLALFCMLSCRGGASCPGQFVLTPTHLSIKVKLFC